MSFDETLQGRVARHLFGVVVPLTEPEFTPSSPGGRHPRELEIHGVPVVIVDPHNEAFYYWTNYRTEKRDWRAEAPTLIHVDAHSDMASAYENPFSDYSRTSFLLIFDSELASNFNISSFIS